MVNSWQRSSGASSADTIANALAAIAASDAVGVDPVQACAALAEFPFTPTPA
jgi:UDP-N-acetylmuramate-alanine ligase